jgi:hypothetical protein
LLHVSAIQIAAAEGCAARDKVKADQVAEVDSDFHQAARELDARFQDPDWLRHLFKTTSELLNMEIMVDRLVKCGRVGDARSVQRELVDRRTREQARANERVQRMYEDQDATIRAKSAQRRWSVIDTAERAKAAIAKRAQEKVDALEGKIARLMAEQQAAWARPMSPTKKQKKSADFERESARLEASPPRVIDRSGDQEVLERLAERGTAERWEVAAMMNEVSPKSPGRTLAMPFG